LIAANEGGALDRRRPNEAGLRAYLGCALNGVPLKLRSLVALCSLGAVTIVGAYTWLHLVPLWQVETSVKRLLTDPESAVFSDVTFSPDGAVACGYVNAKNRMGGYAGRQHFIVIGDYAAIDPEPEIDTSKSVEYQQAMAKIHADYLSSTRAQCAGKKIPP
jgi:hypothetical protein